ncbi:MAG: helix-hairpin-helix domain-containing protein [Bifidobacteriaceae bacterium]|jgi:competence protein ComEA|nr:helix-hairpin-helix domain-containing protein [Bifidobacteriaceae bacterium]
MSEKLLNSVYKQSNGVFTDKQNFHDYNLKNLTAITQKDALNFSPKTKRRSLLSWKTFLPTALAISLIFAGVIIAFTTSNPTNDSATQIGSLNDNNSSNDNTNSLSALQNAKIFIDIQGEINKPGAYELPGGSRISDAIKLAGGLKKDADTQAFNQARKLQDAEQIYIPKKGENNSNTSELTQNSDNSSQQNTAGGININTATLTQLDTLNGIGPAIAQRIIDYRISNGSFSSIEDIKNVKGIGESIFEKIKNQIRV